MIILIKLTQQQQLPKKSPVFVVAVAVIPFYYVHAFCLSIRNNFFFGVLLFVFVLKILHKRMHT